MAFGKITKEDLIAAGLDPDKFASLVGTVVTKAELETLKTSLTTDLTTSLTQTIKDEMASLETRLRGTTTEKKETVNNNNENPDFTAEDFLTDPVGTARKIANQSASVVLGEQRRMAAQSAWDKVTRNKYMAIEAIRVEVETEWKKFNPVMMATPEVLVQNIYDMVVGRHQAEIQQDTSKKEGKYNLIATGGGGNSTINDNGGTKKPEELLSESELKQAQMFGLTPVQWAEQKGKLRYV